MATQTESKSILDNPTVLERAIIYARVSTDEQAESGTSIDNQVEKSLAYAATRNLQVVNIFKEDYTGKLLDRPELNKVREMLRAGLADNLIVYKTNRLDRSEWGINLLMLLQELKQLGVSLHYSQSGRRVDLSNPVEALMQSIEGWQAGEDHRETVTKLYEGRIKRAQDGFVIPHGHAPYGYVRVNINKRWHFEINEPEAQVVRLIFQWYVYGDESGQTLTMHQIANRLNQLGIPTQQGRAWTGPRIQPILANETYAGTWHYRKSSDNPIPVTVPAIISHELWEQARKQLEHNVEFANRNKKPGRYLLSGRVKCGECEYGMVGTCKQDTHGNDKYRYYICENAWPNKKRFCDCHQPSFRVGDVDGKTWDELEEITSNRNRLLAGLHGYRNRQESEVEPIRRELAQIEELIKIKTAEWEGSYADLKLLTSKMAKARLALELERLEQILEELRKRKSELLAQLEKKSLTDGQIDGIIRFSLQVHRAIKTLRLAEEHNVATPELRLRVFNLKRQLLELLDVRVRLFVEEGIRKGEITARFCTEGFTVEFDSTGTYKLNQLTLTWVLFTEIVTFE